MVRLFVRHTVGDYDAWKKGYDEFDSKRRAMGVTDHAVFRSLDDPKDVTIYHDFATRGEADSFMQSAELRSAMQNAGVVGTPAVWLTGSV